jgi:MFS family permease
LTLQHLVTVKMAIQNQTAHQKSIFIRQLTVLWLCRLIVRATVSLCTNQLTPPVSQEPISLTILFPFINDMMEHVLPPSTPRSTIGRYSGLVESVFSIASFSCMYQYGRLSDTRGRKPVILCGLVGIAASLVMLGLSRSYWMVLLARTLSEWTAGAEMVERACAKNVVVCC